MGRIPEISPFLVELIFLEASGFGLLEHSVSLFRLPTTLYIVPHIHFRPTWEFSSSGVR